MKKLVKNEAVRYVFFGGCTTAVNLIVYYCLCMTGMNITVANTISVLAAIVFAYVVNKLFVFEHKTHSPGEFFREIGSFVGMRLGTMVIEVLGVLLLTCIWGMSNMAAKLVIQVVIVVLNYFISKLVVFKDADPKNAGESGEFQKTVCAGASGDSGEGTLRADAEIEPDDADDANGLGEAASANGGHDTAAAYGTGSKNPFRRLARFWKARRASSSAKVRTAKQISRNYFLAGFFASGLVAGVAFALMGVWPFGDKTLLIIDSLHQYLPFYTDFHEKLVDSESFLYSFSGGLGYNFWSTYAYYLASPLNFLMAFIPTANVCDFMDLMILVKIALCGGCFTWYIHKHDEERFSYQASKSEQAGGTAETARGGAERSGRLPGTHLNTLPVVFGMMYALSNFVIGYYFNLMWLDSIAMLPLVMYGIEQIVKGGKGKFYCLALFYGLWCNYYIGFMLCLFSCLYFLVRWIAQTGEYDSRPRVASAAGFFRRKRKNAAPGDSHEKTADIKNTDSSSGNEKTANGGEEPSKSADSQTGKTKTAAASRSFPRDLGKSCLTFAWYSLLAGGMAALVLIPAFMGLTSSESMESNTFPTVVKFYESLAELLENHMAFMEPVTISSTQVGLNVYCGVATVLLAILYLFDHEIRLRERLAHYGLCALLLFSFACNIPNYIWHGFHQQNGLPNRFAFLYIAVLLVMAYEALRDLKKYWLPELIFAVAAPAAFLIVRYLNPERELEGYLFLISLGLLLFYFGFLLIGRYVDRLKPVYFRTALTLVLVVEIAANAIYGVSENGVVTRSIYLADQTAYQNLISDLDEEEDSFYRSEVDRQRMRNVTMFVGGNALVMFNSTMQSSVIDFCDALGIEARTNKNGYLGVTKLMNDVFGIKYVASPTDSENFYQFERVDKDGELTLYENDNALSLGFMVDDAILEWDTSTGEPLDIQNSFVELATGHDAIFVLDRYIDMEDGENYAIKIPDNKQVYMCIDTRVAEIVLNTPEYTKTFSTYTDHLYVINSTSESNLADFTVTLKDTQTTVQAEIYTCSNEAYQEVVDELAKSQLENVAVDGNTVTGDVDVQEAGTLLLTIPYDESWTILVDGEKTEFSCVGGALIGVHLEEGEHSIEMRYTPSGLWVGSGLTLLSALLFLLTMFWERKRKTQLLYNRNRL
ncbi:MAG: YfhO family protein [Lachnospiraceae bacterium]|nr:YfhO family protein [Lachnospiraceae bacterium]